MLKIHRNSIAKKILKHGYNPNDFKIKKAKGYDNTYHIYYKKSKKRFGFMYEPEQVDLFSVGYSTFTPEIKWINGYHLQKLTISKALNYIGK